MKESINLAIVGLGQRGSNMIKNPIIPMMKKYNDFQIVAVCDLLQDRVDDAAKSLEDEGFARPLCTTDYKDVLAMDTVDAVYIAVSWEAHTAVTIAAMESGKYVGLEAGGAYSLDDCFKLVHTYELTGTECMLMENCCYGKRELMMLNMVRKGLFGEVVHCNGAYAHDLRNEITDSLNIRHYRLRNYIHRNGENYPTHEIGPIAKILDINNGNRFISLSSFSSKARGLRQYVLDKKGVDDPLAAVDFRQGDVITTVLTCANGETVCITLDTTRPRAYSRRFEVLGTKATYMEDNDSLFIDSEEEHHKNDWDWKPMWGNAAKYEEHLHPLWVDGSAENDAHGGIDHLVFKAFVESVKTGSHPPIDVYDAAVYMAITPLSEDSIAQGGAPVAFPDFTGGKWTMRTDIADTPYTLDRLNFGRDLYFID